MPTIGLDARTLFAAAPRGTGRNLRDAYRWIPALRPDWRFVLYHRDATQRRPESASRWGHAAPNLAGRELRCPGDRWALWFHLRLPLQAVAERVDLMHYPANAAPAWRPTPYVVTIHDLVPLAVRDECSARERKRFERDVCAAVRSAAAVITPSAATQEALRERIGPLRAPVFVIPWAADERIVSQIQRTTARDIDQARGRFRIETPYVLNFSGPSPRKNSLGLVRAIARIRAADEPALAGVFTGCTPDPFRTTLEREAERLGCADRCRFLPFVDHEDLAPLLAGAAVLAIPSFCEGFGLPVLDAFACGVPVVAADVPALREVAGSAAEYCRPDDPDDIARALRHAVDGIVRELLIQKGRQQLQAFNWQNTAERMCVAYEAALQRVRRPKHGVVSSRPAGVPT